MHNQLVWDSPASSPTEVMATFAASQGQDLLPSARALAQRISAGRTVTEAEVLTAYDDGAILRTHLLRPTWHFVHPADLRWLLRATAPRVHRINGTVYREWGFDEQVLNAIHTTIGAALADGDHLTRGRIGDGAGARRTGPDRAGAGLRTDVHRARGPGLQRPAAG